MINSPLLQMRKLRQTEGKQLSEDHTASKWELGFEPRRLGFRAPLNYSAVNRIIGVGLTFNETSGSFCQHGRGLPLNSAVNAIRLPGCCARDGLKKMVQQVSALPRIWLGTPSRFG